MNPSPTSVGSRRQGGGVDPSTHITDLDASTVARTGQTADIIGEIIGSGPN